MTDTIKYTNKLQGQSVLILGGTSGIGYGVAEACLEHGMNVTISSSSAKKIESSISSLLTTYPSAKSRLRGFPCDLATSETCESNIVALLDKTGKLDHIIHTAGDSLRTGGISRMDLAAIQKCGMVRFFSAQLLAKHAPKYLSPGPKSSLTITTGTVSERPIPGWAVVNAYATGAQGLARGYALDMAPIRVNAICPGAVDTPLWDALGAEEKESLLTKMAQGTCTGSVGQVEDVAEAYIYILKDKNVTGTTITTDGGGLLK
jgi:NAD(P)-dependent dehydrogenase (short-subunit alcohol dehydrogenase family)